MTIVIIDEKNENKTPRLSNEKTKSDVTRELSIENFKEWKKEEDENYFLILSDLNFVLSTLVSNKDSNPFNLESLNDFI